MDTLFIPRGKFTNCRRIFWKQAFLRLISGKAIKLLIQVLLDMIGEPILAGFDCLNAQF